MKQYSKSYSKKYNVCRLFHLVIISHLYFLFNFSTNILIASGAYDNGTATGKGKLSLDLTLNPFDYFLEGQSYIVLAYGISNKFDIHGYYSKPAKGSSNYYIGLFYQFFDNKFLDLSSAIGIRNYIPGSASHLFAPQLLYTIYIYKDFRLGGSLVAIREINKNKLVGTTYDTGLIIPLFKNEKSASKIESIDFSIGFFRPISWKPKKMKWHPTYSINIKLKSIRD